MLYTYTHGTVNPAFDVPMILAPEMYLIWPQHKHHARTEAQPNRLNACVCVCSVHMRGEKNSSLLTLYTLFAFRLRVVYDACESCQTHPLSRGVSSTCQPPQWRRVCVCFRPISFRMVSIRDVWMNITCVRRIFRARAVYKFSPVPPVAVAAASDAYIIHRLGVHSVVHVCVVCECVCVRECVERMCVLGRFVCLGLYASV